jgi:hypothetical protein
VIAEMVPLRDHRNGATRSSQRESKKHLGP